MPKKILTKEEKKALLKKYKKLHIKFSWMILEMKFLYYIGRGKGFKCPSDEYYDSIEDKYRKLCKKLKKDTTACNHVGFPSNTPSGRLVAEKMISNKGKSNLLKKAVY